MIIKVAITSDHGGYHLKTILKEHFKDVVVEWIDLGPYSDEIVDYPDYGEKIAQYIADGQADFGVAICGSGVGISIAVNRNPFARCVLCHDETTARSSREHNNANIIAFGGRFVGVDIAIACLKVFLTTPFSNSERHVKRIEKLSKC